MYLYLLLYESGTLKSKSKHIRRLEEISHYESFDNICIIKDQLSWILTDPQEKKRLETKKQMVVSYFSYNFLRLRYFSFTEL